MKRQIIRLFMFIMIILCSFSAIAQRFGAGLQGGITTTKVSGDRDDLGGMFKLGFFGSVYTDYPVGRFGVLQLELMYIQKGSRAFMNRFDPEDRYRDYRFDLHYVEIPVVFKLDMSEILNVEYFSNLKIEGGLSFSRLIGHYEENYGTNITDSLAINRPFKNFEVNIVGGLYYPIREDLYFHFRVIQGITPVRTHGTSDEITAGTLWQRINRFGQYNTAYTFGLSYNIFAWRRNSSN